MPSKQGSKITITDGDEPVIKLEDSAADKQELAAKIEASVKDAAEPKNEKPNSVDDFDPKANQDTPISQLVAQRETIKKAPKLDADGEFADVGTAKAVDEIVSKETDEVLEAEDKARAEAEAKTASKSKKGKFRDWLARLWSNPASRWGIIVGSAILLILISLLPASRYAILNTFGIRVSSSIKVIDTSTTQPLKNVSVTLRGKTATTNEEGMAYFSGLKMGRSELTVYRRGFAELKRNQVLGWGSNPLPPADLTPTGSQFVFRLTDHLSGQPVTKAEAVSGEFSAFANDKGEISLVVEDDDGTLEVEVIAEGYKSQKVTFNPADKPEKDLQMVAGNPQVFVSKRSGKYDVYKIDADGNNETKILAGTGKERSDLVLAGHPTQNYAALVSTRENKTNASGFLLSGVFILDVGAGTDKKIDEHERVLIVDWHGDNLIYVKITEGASAANPKRSKLMSYNVKTDTLKELATANYFNDVYVARGTVYFAPSSYAIPVDSVKFYKINVDGTGGAQKLFDSEIWSITRSDYDNILLSVNQDWYVLKLGTTTPTKTQAPTEHTSITFEDNADRSQSAWIDERDGKGVLLVRNTTTGADTELKSQAGLTGPIRWLNNTTIVYRVVNSTETAEYVISTSGGEAKKLANVTNTGSAESYLFY